MRITFSLVLYEKEEKLGSLYSVFINGRLKISHGGIIVLWTMDRTVE